MACSYYEGRVDCFEVVPEDPGPAEPSTPCGPRLRRRPGGVGSRTVTRVDALRSAVAATSLLASLSAGCASDPVPAAPRTASQAQPLELVPPMTPVIALRDVAGRYELELVGEGELAGQRLDLVLRREPDVLAAACRAGLWDLEGSAEGGEQEPLAVSLMGLSDRDEAPVAMRLIASAPTVPSGDIEGTAIVERGGVATTLRFVARRRDDGEPHREQCGELVYQHVTQYQGPAETEKVTTRRFEGCVELLDQPTEPTR